tara:strand:- start:5904 stop:6362 length:459 start_codon:yes stop_codon:yes gene_type:complete
MLVIRGMVEADAVLMSEKMRRFDQEEFTAMTHGTPHIDTLRQLLRGSRVAKAAYVDGELVALYGILAKNVLSTEGHPWLAATAMIEDRGIRRLFVKHTKRELSGMLGGFSHLWNLVSDENAVAIRWLKWIGFSFVGDEYAIGGMRFLKFEMR